jgi:TonB-dependent starch-binding outer membrane protein SusC
MKRIFLLFLLSFVTVSAAQKSTIDGKVVDEQNEPLVGVAVVIQGTQTGVVTDLDGSFQIDADPDSDILFQYIGYENKVLKASELLKNPIVSLNPNNRLDEIVVIGYGSQKRSNIVGSVSTVDVDDAKQIPTTNVSELLRGRAAGVQVNLSDARPGGNSNILIRGNVSVAGGNSPLIIVDGLPFDNLNDVSPDDIQSIEVLKDAASTAIYGARASNGVILITTKKAREGITLFSYNSYLTSQTLTRNFDLYDAAGYYDYKMNAWKTRTGLSSPPARLVWDDYEIDLIEGGNYVNWQDLALQDALLQSHTLSATVGTENTKFYTSLNYFTQEGIIPNSGFNRLSYKLNLSHELTDRLNLEAILNIQDSDQSRETGGLFLVNLSPIAKPIDENGELIKYFLGEENASAINPLWDQQQSIDESETTLVDLNIRLNYKILPNLTYSIKAFQRKRSLDQGVYRSSLHSAGDEGLNGIGVLINSSYRQSLLEHILYYDLDANKHNFNFTAVHAYDEQFTAYNQLDKSDFVNDALQYNGLASKLLFNNRNVTQRRVLSYMGRVRYSYDDKYLFEGTMRADGASVFSEDQKWGYFPAASIAYKLDRDLDVDVISQLKIRLSYGATGNQGINPLESLGVANYNPYSFGSTVTSGSSPSTRLRNPNLKWETTSTANLGIDFGLFNNRFNGVIDLYKSNTTDLLLDRALSSSTGYNVTRFNVGELQNTGAELTLNGLLLQKANFSWDAGIIWSTNKNEIVALTGETLIDPETGEEYFADVTDTSGRRLSIGQSINSLWIPEFAGIYQVEDFIPGSPIVPELGAKPGQIRVIDQNADGIIDIQDNIFINADPKWFGSLNTKFRYKNFDLYMDWYTVQGITRINSVLADGEFWKGEKNGPIVPYYTNDSPSSLWPMPNANAAWLRNLNSFAAQDASYIRLRTLTIGYDLGPSAIDFLKIQSGRLYFSGTNLLTLTDFLSYSPEQDLNAGIFPETMNFTVGLNINF